MHLTTVDIRDYRSIFLDGGGQSLRLDLAHGMNTLVGPNNCGKSNVLRAVSLALDPHHHFRAADDVPGPRPFSYPIVTLTFVGAHSDTVDAAVLDAAQRFERSLPGSGTETRAANGEVTLRVSFVPTGDGVRREERIATAHDRARTPPASQQLELQAIEELRQAVRFVLISSGESIESVLEGNFREILHSVVRERLHAEFATAEQSRSQYVLGLQESLLAPLRDRLAADVRGLFPEIDGVVLSPAVSSIEETLSNVDVSIDDLVTTPLAGKGTGVRGGLLVAMLSYLALHATRGMVFAVEEPEAFLHPGAQELLREQLEAVAAVNDISLLVTTHSPFIVTCSPNGRVFCLAKDQEGRTRIADYAPGDADHAPLIGGLLREGTIESLLAASSAIPAGTEAVVLVEGDGDRLCLRRAAELVGRPELLDGLEIIPTGGTTRMILQAVVAKTAVDVPVLVLVDNDEPGRHVRSTLVGQTFGFSKKEVITYAQLFDDKWQNEPVEAEDVFAPDLIQDFVDGHGPSVVAGSKRRPDGAFHYDFDQVAKEALDTWLREQALPAHVEKWIELIRLLRQRAGLTMPDATVEEIIAGAPGKPEGDADRKKVIDGDLTLVLTGQHDYARYLANAAVVLDGDVHVSDAVTHVAFYQRGIQPEIPRVLDEHPNVLFAKTTCGQLRRTEKPADAVVADLIEQEIRENTSMVGASHHVLVLSTEDDAATTKLEAPIKNTKTNRGKPVAWTVGPRIVPHSALAAGPATTDDLDAIIEKTEGSPR